MTRSLQPGRDSADNRNVLPKSILGRPFRFSLATMAVILTLVAIALGVWTGRAMRQKRARGVIGDFGHVVYWHEYSFEGLGRVDYTASPPGPRWLRQIIGDDYFQSVRMVNFAPTDAAMAALSGLPTVDQITLDACQLTDQGLAHLSAFPKLRKLAIWRGHKLTSSGLAVLESLPELEVVTLNDIPVDRQCLRYLKGATKLQQLYITSTHIKESDLTELRALFPDALLDVDRKPYAPPTTAPVPSFTKETDMKRGATR